MQRILFVCFGNTCRSPMAMAIATQMVKDLGSDGELVFDSAANIYPGKCAALEARQAIVELYGKDLLATHKPKSIQEVKLEDYDLILTMTNEYKSGLPPEKTFTLKEYAGLTGPIADPIGGQIGEYISCRDEINGCLEKIIPRLSARCKRK